jgi:hypothetical protein
MLNAIPDTRNPDEMTGVFLAPKDEDNDDYRDGLDTDEKLASHETIDLDERRKSSITSSKSDSSSCIKTPKRNSTVDMGKKFIKKVFDISKD